MLLPIPPRARTQLLLAAALAALVLFAFRQVGEYGLVNYDDSAYLAEGTPVRDGLSWHGTLWALTARHEANWHPLTWISHMADFSLFGADFGAHHLVSLALHLANALLLFRALSLFTGAALPSAAAAALFAVHPLRVEAVAWIAERKELLATLFFLLALLAYRRYAARPSPLRMAPVAAAFALGLAAKPMVVTLPFALLLLDHWPLRRTAAGAPAASPSAGWRLLAAEKAPLFLLAAASCAVTLSAQRFGGATAWLGHLSLPARASNALVACARYLGKTLWPADLSVFYQHPERPWPIAVTAGAALLLALATVLVVRARRRAPAALVGWLWFLGTLVPVLGLVQVGWQSMADRYTYLPHAGLLAGCVFGAAQAAYGRRLRAALGASAAAALLALCLLTQRQVPVWRDGETLFRHALAATGEGNWLAAQNLGALLVRRGENEEARRLLESALRFKLTDADVWYNLGVVYQRTQKLGQARAAYRQAIVLDPGEPDAYANLGLVALTLGLTDEAVAALAEAVRLDPHREFERRELEYARALLWARGTVPSGSEAQPSTR